MGQQVVKYILDSNIIIYHLNGNKTATDFILQNIHVSTISQITYIEVLSYEFASKEDFLNVKEFMENFEILDTSKAVAVQCIKNRRIRKIKVPDNIIASTAQVYDYVLVTNNIEDFRGLSLQITTTFE
ncbi:MAG: type II toxin-antitoxin system VapC family toxin [Desulfonatronovibrio sp. MSAO_Bac4]|nr:MAG: type II toxin-antitoxin system VapC family toxin [Desulfonatronovibrio sp. MSAO_Bac4]